MSKSGRFLLLTLVLIILLTACRDKVESPVVSFLYWTETYEEGIEMNEWLAEYNTLTGKLIEQLPSPFEGYEQKLIILLGAQRAPDLFVLTPDRFSLYRDKGALFPLNEYFYCEEIPLPAQDKYSYLYDPEENVYGFPANGQIYVIFTSAQNPDESWELLKYLLQKLEVLEF